MIPGLKSWFYWGSFQIGFEAKLAWASTHTSKLQAPRQMLADMKADFGGVVVPIIKVNNVL